MDEILTPEQRNVLHPAAARGFLGDDLFSSGVVWKPFVRKFRFASREDLEKKLLNRLSAGLKLTDAMRNSAATEVSAWSDSFSADYLSELATPMVLSGVVAVSRVQTAARAQLKMQNALMTRIGLGPAQQKELRENTVVFVPFLNARR